MYFNLSSAARSLILATVGASLVIAGVGITYVAIEREERTIIRHELIVTLDLRTLEEPLTAEQQLRAAVFERETERLLGNDVSLRFEILPLLREHASLELTMASGSVMQFYLEGTMRNSERLKQTIERLHKSVRALLTHTSIERRNFEQGFSAVIARVNEKAVTTNAKDMNGWHTFQTHTASGTGLVTALWNDRFIISNDPERLRAKIIGNVVSPLAIHCQIAYPLARCRF